MNATGPSTQTATTDAAGHYTFQGLPAGHYSVVPSFSDGRKPDPENRAYDLTGNVAGADFAVCPVQGPEGTTAITPGIRLRSSASAVEPCRRVYTIVIKAWMPQRSVVDPSVGSDSFDGSGFPIVALAHTPFTSDAYPPCLGAGKLQGFVESRTEAYWRARFEGDGHRGFSGSGWGSVTVPISYDGSTEQFTLRNASVTSGRMTRAYDWSFDRDSKRFQTCTVDRAITPTYGVYDNGDNTFEIDVSWPIPFKPYEDLGDVKDFAGLVLDPVTKSVKDEMEKHLEKVPGYKSLNPQEKAKVKEWANWLVKHVGLKEAKAFIDYALKKSKDYLLDKTPPAVKWGQKAYETLQKLAYGSGDMRVVGHFSKTRSGVGLTLTVDSDAFPSYGIQVQRTATRTNPLPWRGSNDALQIQNPFDSDWPDYVVNDATTTMGPNQPGGPAAKALVVSNLAILVNKTPPILAPIFPPHPAGHSQTKTMSWSFILGKS